MYILHEKKQTYFCTYCNKDYWILTIKTDDGKTKSKWQITKEQKKHVLENFIEKNV